MRRKQRAEVVPPHPPVTSLTGSDDPLRRFYEPPPELAQHFTKRTMSQFECHECCLEVRDRQLEGHWRWHETLLAAVGATPAQ